MKKHIKLLVVLGIILVGSFSFYLFKGYKKDALVYENNKIKPSSSGIAMMLETSAGSGNYEMTTRSEWPTEGYVFNANLSKCENGSELSWDNENKKVLMSGNKSDKCYVYFDVYVKPTIANTCSSGTNLATCIKTFGDKGSSVSNIYHHDGNLENGINDNSYRFAGASDQVNNYVCFGSTAAPCPTDNLYRIIGVFDNKVGENQTEKRVKLIKSTSVENKYWDTNAKNIWSTSSLNSYLNNEFINTFDETTKGKIAETTWKVGGNTHDNIAKKPAKTAYQNEVVNPVPGSTSSNGETQLNAKIGLMYVSDYGFAAAPSDWTTNLYNYDVASITRANWMYLGATEWTISRSAAYSHTAFFMFSSGYVTGYCINNAYNVVNRRGVRPVFSLSSSTSYVSGSGTATDPIVVN